MFNLNQKIMKVLSVEKMESIEGGYDLMWAQCAISWLIATDGASEAEVVILESIWAQTYCYVYMY
jgi:hypothetical protein